MNKKLQYSAPEAELLVVRFEENFLQSGETTNRADKDYEDNELGEI